MINQVGPNLSGSQYNYSNDKVKGKGTGTKDEGGVSLELGKSQKSSSVYKKPVTYKPDMAEINRLLRETEKSTNSLRNLVERLIGRQGLNAQAVFDGSEVLNIDAQAKEDAEKLLSEDGELGVKQTSQRIVDYAKALSGGDKGKISELRDAIKQGFDEASKVLGGLPDISQRTYDEVMKQLDEWEKGE